MVGHDVAAAIPALIDIMRGGLQPTAMNEVGRMVGKMAIAYPNAKLSDEETEARLELYIELLKDIPFDVLSNAFKRVTQTLRFFPSVSEIREAAAPELGRRRAQLMHLEMLLEKHRRGTAELIVEYASAEDVARIKAEVAAEFSERRKAFELGQG